MNASIKYFFENILGSIISKNPEVSTLTASNPDATLDEKLKNINVHKPTKLCKLMKGQNSDKGIARHNYTTVYDALFSEIKNGTKEMFEMGIGTNNTSFTHNMGKKGTPGASLRGWSTYFPNSNVYGADIDKGALFEEDRIKTYYCDQLDADVIKNMWKEIGDSKEFKVIIDDGLHTFEANVSLFESSIHKLSKSGYYVVEDVKLDDIPKWEKRIKEKYLEEFPDLVFATIKVPNRPLRDIADNNLIVMYYSRN